LTIVALLDPVTVTSEPTPNVFNALGAPLAKDASASIRTEKRATTETSFTTASYGL
jgi:hypothetical protein